MSNKKTENKQLTKSELIKAVAIEICEDYVSKESTENRTKLGILIKPTEAILKPIVTRELKSLKKYKGVDLLEDRDKVYSECINIFTEKNILMPKANFYSKKSMDTKAKISTDYRNYSTDYPKEVIQVTPNTFVEKFENGKVGVVTCNIQINQAVVGDLYKCLDFSSLTISEEAKKEKLTPEIFDEIVSMKGTNKTWKPKQQLTKAK